VTHFPAKLTSRMAASGRSTLKSSKAPYVRDRADHAISGGPQLGVELQCNQVLVFDNQYSGSVVHDVPRSSRLHRRCDVNAQTGGLVLQFHRAP
jgi:hypothetical protein